MKIEQGLEVAQLQQDVEGEMEVGEVYLNILETKPGENYKIK